MKTLGVIGGMGPEATTILYNKILVATNAKSDQEHIPTIIYSNTQIPDRTKAILSKGLDPSNEMIKTAKVLEAMGSDILVMPCNTAHYFYDKVNSNVECEVVNMIDETAKTVSKKYKDNEVIIFATSGTIKSQLYTNAFDRCNLKVLVPSVDEMTIIMSMIYDGIKKGNRDIDTSDYEKILIKYINKNVKAVILGCTELPILHELNQFPDDLEYIDPMEIAAKKCVSLAK